MSANEPTIASILHELSAEYNEPVAERQILERVLERRPSSAKNPYATIRERLRWDGPALGWLRLDRHQLVPLRVVLNGLRFRCQPRLWELEAGLLALIRLQPFIGLRNPSPTLYDQDGVAITPNGNTGRIPERDVPPGAPCFDLRAWYEHTRFAPGDSIIVTVKHGEPVILQIVHEPAAAFRADDVAHQDAELIEGIAERALRTNVPLIPCDELVLPIFARAPWRTSYPGTAWQQLVLRDQRLQMVDHIFVAARSGRDFTFFGGGLPEAERQATLAALREEIDLFQMELQRSRQHDVDEGIWSGELERAGHANPQRDAFAALNELEANDYELEDEGWESEFQSDIPLIPDEDELVIDPMAFDLSDANRRLLAALPEETVERLQHARPEEVEVLIAAHLNELLVKEPSLFPRLGEHTEGASAAQAGTPGFSDVFDSVWDDLEVWDDEEWDDDLEEFAGESARIYAQSSDLISRFYEHLISEGKHQVTAQAHARNLALYGDFIAQYYHRDLSEGDYVTLDEFLFSYFPRRVTSSSPRRAREFCTSVKQFYAFLRTLGDIADDRFAAAIWRRRDEAARVIELYGRIPVGTSEGDALCARLFAPYMS